MSLTDLFRLLLRHWWKIILFSLGVTVLSGVCFVTRSDMYEARMSLDEMKCEILYDVAHVGSARQHFALAQSTGLVARVNARMRHDGLSDGDDADRVFKVSPLPGAARILSVSARQPAPDKAVRSLSVWAEEYTKLAQCYRARRLLYDQERQLRAATTLLTMEKDSLRRVRQEWWPESRSNEQDESMLVAVSNKISELQGDLALIAYSNQMTRAVIRGLTFLCEEARSNDTVTATTNAEDLGVKEHAQRLVMQGMDELFSEPESVPKRNTTRAKIVVVFLLALGVASATALIVEGMRGDKPDSDKLRNV